MGLLMHQCKCRITGHPSRASFLPAAAQEFSNFVRVMTLMTFNWLYTENEKVSYGRKLFVPRMWKKWQAEEA